MGEKSYVMFPFHMSLEITFCRSLVAAVITREGDTFMSKSNMGVETTLLSALIITLVTVKFDT